MSPKNEKIERVACYIRVSTQEQKLHGISLDAQRDKLKEYADTHGLKIVGWYEDEGVSGRKLIKNRPELQRMIKDAQAGIFDRIIFIKLDRFFRSVAEYHECMKLIDPVLWTATEEKYDLTTANGRAFVNMKITIAELEADQTGERIGIVNDYKVKTGQAITGSFRQGVGYKVEKIDGIKRVVIDPDTREMCTDYINHFLQYQNKRQAFLYIKEKYNCILSYNVFTTLLNDTKIYGFYRGNPDYCEPYVDKATYDKIQDILKRNIRDTPAKRIFLFTGLLICPVCGLKLSGKYTVNRNKTPYYHYRCNHHAIEKECTYNKMTSELKIEKELVNNLDKYIHSYIKSVNVLDNRADIDNKSINKRIKEVKTEMSNSVKSFNKGRMTEVEHDREYEALEAELKALEAQLAPLQERDLTVYESLLESDWKSLYNALNRDNKRAFWRKYVKEIKLNPDATFKEVIFF